MYVPTEQVLATAAALRAHSFDMRGAEYDRRNNKCTFEVLIDKFGLTGAWCQQQIDAA